MSVAPEPPAEDSLVEQLEWIEIQLDAAVAASGVIEGWSAPFVDRDIPWDTVPHHREEILGSLLPQACDAGGQLVQDLVLSDAPDSRAAAAHVWAAWEAAGWSVSDVYDSTGQAPHYFRADRSDGAVLSLDADPSGIILRVRTSCSAHPSVTDPTADLSERDAFLAELLARTDS